MRIGLGYDLRTKVPWTFLAAIGGVALVGLYFGLVFFEVIDRYTLFHTLTAFPLSWAFQVVFAILGALFIGMFIATRSLSAKGLTPFEASMLRMHEEVRDLGRQVKELKEAIQELSSIQGDRALPALNGDENEPGDGSVRALENEKQS